MPKRVRNIDRNKCNFVPFVDTLVQKDFAKTIDAKKSAFVLFYDPRTCKSKEVTKPFVELAHVAASKKRGFYAVDCLNQPELCQMQKVSCTPAFKLYVNGLYLNDYDSAAVVETMKKFVESAPIPGECRHKSQRTTHDQVFCSLCFAESQN